MARLNDDQREKILADFHAGKSQRELAKRYEVSPATINSLCKGIEPKNIDKVNALTRIKTELAEQTEHEVNAVQKEVDERMKHILFFNSAAIRNVQEAMNEPCASQQDFRARAETIVKGRETVLGKSPETAVQINNAQPVINVSFPG